MVPKSVHRLLILVFLFCFLHSVQAQKRVIAGYVVEAETGEALAGARVTIEQKAGGTITNSYGFFSLSLTPTDSVRLIVSMVGYATFRQTFARQRLSSTLRIKLSPSAQELKEVTVTAPTDDSPQLEAISLLKLNARQVSQLPALLGEKDIIKVLQLLPGVQKGTEGSTALYVRGGGGDQNLILLDDAPVYNASHLFGFFSVFNNDAINDVEFYKGGFPARYGGRASSVLDMRMREGNRQKFSGTGGVGLIASRLTLEGPLNKKSSFLLSGRRTYLDLLTKPLQSKKSRTGYYFYDLNAKLNYEIGANDRVYLSGYFGDDELSTFARTGQRTITTQITDVGWGNATATLRWNHIFSQRLFLNTTLYKSQYRFRFTDDVKHERPEGTQTIFSEYASGVNDWGLRVDADYFPSNSHTLKFGVHLSERTFKPRAYTATNSLGVNQQDVTKEHAQENALYVSDVFRPSAHFSATGGLRAVQYKAGGLVEHFLEPRLILGYQLNPGLVLKGSYATMNQFVHVLTNTGAGLPTDLWVPANLTLRPQRSRQVTIGVDKKLKHPDVLLTVEAYYKKLNNVVAYREGASFLIVGDEARKFDWESNVTSGTGWSYGLEVLARRSVGKLTGWVGYTLSRTQQQFAELNFGRKFYPRFDRRHDVSVVGTYRLSPKIILSGVWVFGTGNALTLPTGSFNAPQHSLERGLVVTGGTFADYDGRNSFRAAAYHRLDASIQLHKAKRWGSRFWEFGLYNAYNRRNPFYYKVSTEYVGKEVRTSIRRVPLFPVIPSVSYNFRF